MSKVRQLDCIVFNGGGSEESVETRAKEVETEISLYDSLFFDNDALRSYYHDQIRGRDCATGMLFLVRRRPLNIIVLRWLESVLQHSNNVMLFLDETLLADLCDTARFYRASALRMRVVHRIAKIIATCLKTDVDSLSWEAILSSFRREFERHIEHPAVIELLCGMMTAALKRAGIFDASFVSW